MDYLAALRCFVRSVELGSFSKAAQERGIKVSTVSRYVAALEEDLGAALLNRSTHRLHLTQTGGMLYDDAVRILADLDQARARASSSNKNPEGRLRVTIPTAFGRMHVVPRLAEFMERYPKISLEVMLADANIDLIETGMDLAIRIGALADSAMIARRLAPHLRVLCAAPSYLECNALLTQPSDLARHEALLFSLAPRRTWHFEHRETAETVDVEVSGRLLANETEALLACARAGQGIALLPTWAVYGDVERGDLVALLPQWRAALAPGIDQAIWVIYPPKKIVAPKVRVFIAFLNSCFHAPISWDDICLNRLPPSS